MTKIDRDAIKKLKYVLKKVSVLSFSRARVASVDGDGRSSLKRAFVIDGSPVAFKQILLFLQKKS